MYNIQNRKKKLVSRCEYIVIFFFSRRRKADRVRLARAQRIFYIAFLYTRLRVIREISRLWFTAAIYKRERGRLASRPVGAYYRDTSFTKRNYCLLPSLWYERRKFAILRWSRFCAASTLGHANTYHARALFWHRYQERRLHVIGLLTMRLYRGRERIPDAPRPSFTETN